MAALMKKRFKLAKNQKGMTLIELMAVVVILGILAAVAGTAVMGGFTNARTNADESSIRIIEDAAERYMLDNPTATAVTFTDLTGGGYLKEEPEASDGGTFSIAIDTTNGTATVTHVAPTP